ncbi:MAG: hypothetical protein VKK97_08595 [Synechococcaceae cyanobacterium]|nr:hypothetical protein [Synechococcaceae cyanobacterium]
MASACCVIGDGAVVALGAVVIGVVSQGTFVRGNPAVIACERFVQPLSLSVLVCCIVEEQPSMILVCPDVNSFCFRSFSG